MILVAGGTGRLGSALVRRLRDASQPVTVLTRDPARAQHLRPLGAHVAVGDVRRPVTLEAAMEGVTTVVSAVHGFGTRDGCTPATVDRDGNAALINAAAAAGADVVLMSVLGASHDHPLPLVRMKAAAEDELRMSSVAWTVVRSAAFAELHLEILQRTAGRAKAPVVLGRGNNPVNVVSVEDVAEVVTQSVAGGFHGRVLDVGGPEDVTFDDLARTVQISLGRTDQRIRHVPRRLLRVLSRTQAVPRLPIGQIAAAALAFDTTPMTYEDLHDPDAVTWRGARRIATLATAANATK
jgi:NADH dehydrogenase